MSPRPMTSKSTTTARRIASECLAGRARLISRAVSSIYDDALRPHGITTAQMGILAAVTALGQPRSSDVAKTLCLEKSTLSRNLDRMIDHGWLEIVAGDDERSQRLRTTPKGARLVEKVAPAWQTAQRRARTLLGEQGAATLQRVGDKLMAGGSP
ncbi:MAG: winged helix-turn-helix transcriptional regulator [Planctomycetes bacterium]|nr:winged helix-turn-helix transcriptional regulator [Planctomycetota bacterium]